MEGALRFGERRLPSLQSTKRNLLQHQSAYQKGSDWLLLTSSLKVNFNTVVVWRRCLGDQTGEGFYRELELSKKQGQRGRVGMEGSKRCVKCRKTVMFRFVF